MSRATLASAATVTTHELRDRHLVEIYALGQKPGQDSLAFLAELELMIAYPGDLYRRVVRDHFSLEGTGLCKSLLKEQLPKVELTVWSGKADITLLYQNFHETLLLLLKKGTPALHIFSLLKDINANYVRTINKYLTGTAIASLEALLNGLRERGISDTAILNLMLSPSSTAALRTEDRSSAAVSTETHTSPSSEEDESFSELNKEIFDKHLQAEARNEIAISTNFPALKLLVLFPDKDFHEKVVSLILNPKFLQNHQNKTPKDLYDLLGHLLDLGVPAERILEALRTKTGSYEPEDYLHKLLSNRPYPDNNAMPEAFKFLAVLARRSGTTQAEILEWLTKPVGALTEAGAGTSTTSRAKSSFESKFTNSYVYGSTHSHESVSTMQTYLSLIEQLDPTQKTARKKAIYETLIKQGQNERGFLLTLEILEDHDILLAILRENISYQARSFEGSLEKVGLKTLRIIKKLSENTEISFSELFNLLKEVHRVTPSYTNEDLELLFPILINLFNKEATPENAKLIVELLSSKAMSMFHKLVYGTYRDSWSRVITRASLTHLHSFFNLLNQLKGNGITDIEIQKLSSSFNYHMHYAYDDYPSQFSLADLVNKTRPLGERDLNLIYLMLSQNHCSAALVSTLANDFSSHDLATYIEHLPIAERYHASLKVVIGEGSLARYFNEDVLLSLKKLDFVKFLTGQGALLLSDIQESKFSDRELMKLAFCKEALSKYIQTGIENEDEKFSLSLQAHDASTPLGRYFSLITHGSSNAFATKKILSEALAVLLKANIAKVYALLLSGTLTDSQRKGLAFLKEEVAAHMKTLPEPQRLNDHVDALIKESALGQFFYEPRDKTMAGYVLGFNATSVTKGILKTILDELKLYPKESLFEFLKDGCRMDQFETMRFLEGDLVKHLGLMLSDEEFSDHYTDVMNISKPNELFRYYFVLNDQKPVTPASPIMRNLNLMLANKAHIFSMQIELGLIARDSFAPKSLKEIQDEFMKAMQRLANDQCKSMLKQALDPEKKLQAFLSDRQKELHDLQTKSNQVRVSSAGASLFARGALSASGSDPIAGAGMTNKSEIIDDTTFYSL